MVFSTLFGKKRDKPEESARPAQDSPAAKPESAPAAAARPVAPPPQPAAGRPATGAAPNLTASVPAGGLSARDMARATAAKIDRIESEMAADFSARETIPGPNFTASAANNAGTAAKPAATPGASGAPARPATAAAPARPAGTATRPHGAGTDVMASNPAGRRRRDGMTTTVPALGQSTDILLGDSILANAMELSDSASNPAIEEAAILYANGQALPAAAALQEAIRTGAAGANNAAIQAWLMLFELFQLLGKKTEFESLGIDFAVRFDSPAPLWDDSAASAPPPAPAAERAAVVFSGTLNGGIVPQLDQLKRLAQKNPSLRLEFDQVTAVESVGADLMLRVFAAFQKSNHEVVLQGCAHLAGLCQGAIEVGRRDASSAVWMLLLELYRLLGRRAAFDEVGIDYCVTYEVSPPSWEPPAPRFRVEDPDTAPAKPAADEALPPDTIALKGDLVGKAETEVARLTTFASSHNSVIIDCTQLRRVDFTAAGSLLNWAVGMQVGGTPVRFREVGHLVAALFAVMGLHEVAQIERRGG